MEMSKILLSGKELTLSQTSPVFYVFAEQVFENTDGKGEIVVTSGFFYLFEELSTIFIKFEIVVCKLFRFGRV